MFQNASINLGGPILWRSNRRLSRVPALGSRCGRRQRGEGHWRASLRSVIERGKALRGKGSKLPPSHPTLLLAPPLHCPPQIGLRVSLSHVGRQTDVFKKARIFLLYIVCILLGTPDTPTAKISPRYFLVSCPCFSLPPSDSHRHVSPTTATCPSCSSPRPEPP